MIKLAYLISFLLFLSDGGRTECGNVIEKLVCVF